MFEGEALNIREKPRKGGINRELSIDFQMTFCSRIESPFISYAFPSLQLKNNSHTITNCNTGSGSRSVKSCSGERINQ